jgi:hypothetical protein
MTRTLRRFVACTLALPFALLAARADAVSISMDPASSVVAVGDSVEIALNVSGLVDNAAPSLSSYDIDLTWDASVIQLSLVSIGDPVLGDQLDPAGLGTVVSISFGVGSLNLSEQSLDSVADLDAQQAGSFTIATMTFQLLAAGPASITPSVVAMDDANGRPLPIESVTGATVSAIPEPSAAVLTVAGLLLVRTRIRRAAVRVVRSRSQ